MCLCIIWILMVPLRLINIKIRVISCSKWFLCLLLKKILWDSNWGRNVYTSIYLYMVVMRQDELLAIARRLHISIQPANVINDNSESRGKKSRTKEMENKRKNNIKKRFIYVIFATVHIFVYNARPTHSSIIDLNVLANGYGSPYHRDLSMYFWCSVLARSYLLCRFVRLAFRDV